jgi:hypothetical protein
MKRYLLVGDGDAFDELALDGEQSGLVARSRQVMRL